MVQQYSLEYKAQLLLINYFCNLRLDKFLKKLKHCINSSQKPHQMKVELGSNQAHKDDVPGSWDDAMAAPTKKKRARTPAGGKGSNHE